MGAYTCEYGIVHKVCRCPMPHKIKCDVSWKHKPSIGPTTRFCIVWEKKMSGEMPSGKHEAHPAHDWWCTTGGYQMNKEPMPGDFDYHRSTKWHCPGDDY